ncbi:hypothetical protein AVEN_146660-1 [Araneus ventricosus]|uniref:Tc1-like transposase DDE domain-containing protein n=1 Tax=Araneus ventricosus TaxID=182803 RepID=A0A4Y2KNK9_ARAVE|nr:hypothetical protein AVEN_146660-1 [Araneus ventricosus]
MSDKCIRSVSAAAMAGYQDLSDFERGIIIGTREMGHSISEVAMEFCVQPFHECTVNIRYPGTVQSVGASVMVWDVCSWRDMGPLIRLETTLTVDRYLSILPNYLHSFMSIVHFDRLGQFQQDNATPHASRVATKWLQEHSSDFRHFHWPPKSPEMNIIEDIRDALLYAVENRSPPPRSPMDLWTVLKDEWCELPPRYFQTLVESMPHRVAGLLCVHGVRY